MSDYKRFVSYIYGYKQGEKGESTGFVKVNARGGECRIWVHVRGFYTHHQEPYRVYAFKQKKEGLEGQYLGELERCPGMGRCDEDGQPDGRLQPGGEPWHLHRRRQSDLCRRVG